MNRWVLLGLAALVSLVLAACGGGGGNSEQTANPAAGHSENADDGVAEVFIDPVGEERVIEVRTEDFRFVPDTITVKVGETIRLKLENRDPVLHDYTTDEAEFIVLEASGASHGDHDVVAAHDDDHGVDTEAQVSLQPLHIAAEGDEHGELVFEATEPDEYVFYCSVPGHKEAGMVGTIIIEE